MTHRIALLGAESTGKTQLAVALVAHLQAQGHSAVHVPEVLREWCDAQGRTPRADEQQAIAQAQAHRVHQAHADYVVADTTPLMTAVYSDLLFDDKRLYAFALAHQRHTYAVTLLMGLDLPWVADGLQRDGPHAQQPTDQRLRTALAHAGLSFGVVYGQGDDRLKNAIDTINSIANYAATTSGNGLKTQSIQRWNSLCEKCSDPDCEYLLFSHLTKLAV